MKNRRAKKIAPIVVTVLAIVYYALYFGVIISTVPPVWGIVLGAVPVLLAGVTIYVCVQRIREINGGEEDDLGQY